MTGYEIIDIRKLEDHVTFIRINPTDIGLTLKTVFESLSNLAWITHFDQEYVQDGFRVRAEDTVKYIADKIIKETDDKITSDSGEYVVSELARKAIVEELKYLDIPLAELFLTKDSGNHGFDFFSRNNKEILLFGEAKYNARQNAYGKSLKQIVQFETEKRDVSDLLEIDKFCCENSKKNFSLGSKGYIAAFSSKKTTTDQLIIGIKNNTDYKSIIKHKEIICVAVNL